MKRIVFTLIILVCGSFTLNAQIQKHNGFFDFTYVEEFDQIQIEVDKLNNEFLYVSYLSRGLGSTSLNLDRGQIGNTKIVKFEKRGNRLLLIQPNYNFRASSTNIYERKAVEEAFPKSILWSFEIIREGNGVYVIDITDFLLRDAHQIIPHLKKRKQGHYSLDKNRSGIFMEQCKNFPLNSEFEVMTTYTGNPEGNDLYEVTVDASSFTVHQHHTFAQLPDNNFKPRFFNSRSGYFFLTYKDFASPLHKDLDKKFIYKHRLKKKNPGARTSEAKEPIIYYVDRGAPEPIRTALLEGARWWEKAFEEIGYKDAFKVELLPEGADPLDIRYNVIQWVHRSSRGWSYGGTIADPRTGEIIKGKVTLGSLRVRQDYMIAEGLLSPYERHGKAPKEVEEMALARIRQLSAHEVGHTLGLAHNFTASTQGRNSVMDYPHPLVELINGKISLANAYTDEIGKWDIAAIEYGYQDFPRGTDEVTALAKMVQKHIDQGLNYLSDQDVMINGAHPYNHQWDNGVKAYEELERVLEIRKVALNNMGKNTLKMGENYSRLEEILVPIYFFHRYQVEATAKIIGGLEYNYATRGDGQLITQMIPTEVQEKALKAMIKTLKPEVLSIPEQLLELIPPPSQEFSKTKENIISRNNPAFDALAAAEAAASITINSLLHPARLGRLYEYKARNNEQPGLEFVIDKLVKETWRAQKQEGINGAIEKTVDLLFLEKLLEATASSENSELVRSFLLNKLLNLKLIIEKKAAQAFDDNGKAHYQYALRRIDLFLTKPEKFIPVKALNPPPGPPIGMGF